MTASASLRLCERGAVSAIRLARCVRMRLQLSRGVVCRDGGIREPRVTQSLWNSISCRRSVCIGRGARRGSLLAWWRGRRPCSRWDGASGRLRITASRRQPTLASAVVSSLLRGTGVQRRPRMPPPLLQRRVVQEGLGESRG